MLKSMTFNISIKKIESLLQKEMFIKEHFFRYLMGEIDYVIPNVQVTWKGKVDLKEVYSFAKKWLLERKYDLSENEYRNDETDSGNNLRIKWTFFTN